MLTKEKVGAFVVRGQARGPHELLLFTHVDFPDAPIQIPGGSLEPGEDPAAGVRRELYEEAGLTGLPLLRKLGISDVPWQGTLFRRHCYVFDGASLPERWVHTVSGDGVDRQLRFEYRWHTVAVDFQLSGDLGFFLKPEFLPELYSVSLPIKTSG